MKKRRICQICVVSMAILILCFYTGGERFYKALRPSMCEQVFKEDDIAYLTGKIYKKEENLLYLKDLKILVNNETLAAEERLPVYLAESTASQLPEIGKMVLVQGSVKTIQEAPNPGNFNQKFYYQKQNIHIMLQNAEIQKSAGKGDSFQEGLWRVRQKLSEKIIEAMGETYGGILCAMLLGEKNHVDEDVKELLQKSGLGHLIAISGLHMTFIGTGMFKVIKKLGLHKNLSIIVSILGLSFYVLLVGSSVSALRAYIMFVLRMGANLLGREYDGLTAMATAAGIQFLYNPLQLFDAGFLLSYGAVLGIYGISESVEEIAGKRFAVPISLQFVLTPIMLYSYYEICIYSILWNLLAIPLAGALLGNGILGLITGVDIFYKIAELIICFYEQGSSLVLELPGARWVIGQPQISQIIMYYSILMIAIMCIKKQKKIIAVLALVGAGLILTVPHQVTNELEIVMLNVGQGDGFFIESPSGETYLIDGGSSSVNSVGQYRIEPFLKSQGVGCLDYVFVSHGDEDHINGIIELVERQKIGVKIRNLILPPRHVWEEKIMALAALAKEEQIAVYEMKQGESLEKGNLKFTCLWPNDEVETSGNEASLVLSLSYGEFQMLFTGDLEKESEEKVGSYLKEKQENGSLPQKYEVLKVGHHGSKNSTNETLLEIVNPNVAWVSAGEDNRYGHPHEDVLLRLANREINLYNTKDGSAVKLCTDGEKYYILEP